MYFFQTSKEQVTGDIDKVTTTLLANVSAANTTTHNLKENDIVNINVIPNLTVGIGTTAPISVEYNSEFDKLLINPLTFASSDVETNKINITNNLRAFIFYKSNCLIFLYKVLSLIPNSLAANFLLPACFSRDFFISSNSFS